MLFYFLDLGSKNVRLFNLIKLRKRERTREGKSGRERGSCRAFLRLESSRMCVYYREKGQQVGPLLLCLQTPPRRLIDIYLVLSVVLCLILIRHRELRHVKCQPCSDSSLLFAAGISPTPSGVPGRAVPSSRQSSGWTPAGPIFPKRSQPRAPHWVLCWGVGHFRGQQVDLG